MEVPCSAPAPSWNSLFDSFLEFKGVAGLPLSAKKFAGFPLSAQVECLGGASWLAILSFSLCWGKIAYPGWQFFLLFFVLGKNCLGGLTWLEKNCLLESFFLSKTYLGGVL